MSNESASNVTVGRLRRLLDEADLVDNTPVFIMQDRGEVRFDEDDGERDAVDVTATKGYGGEASALRLWMRGSTS